MSCDPFFSPPSGGGFIIVTEIATATRRMTVTDQFIGGGTWTVIVRWQKDTDDLSGQRTTSVSCTCPEFFKKSPPRCRHTKAILATGFSI